MVKVCQVTSVRLVHSTGCSDLLSSDCTYSPLFFPLSHFWASAFHSFKFSFISIYCNSLSLTFLFYMFLSSYFLHLLALHHFLYHYYSSFLALTSSFLFMSVYICFQLSEGHGSPAHSRSGSIRSVASDGGAAIRQPGGADSSPRRALYPPSTTVTLCDG